MTVSIFGTDGVRGPAGEGVLESSSVRALAAAFAQSLTAGDRRVALVRDTRESGTWLRDAVAEGLAAAGAQAVDLGVLPTPALSWWLASDGTASGGIAITASHNPWYDNGLKLFAADGTKVPDSLQASCEEHYRSRPSLPPAQTSGTPMLDESAAAEQGYVRSLSAGIEGALGGKTVVIDHASGAAWRVLPAALRGAGALPIGVAPDPTGRNINDNVGAVHPERAAEAVSEHGAWAGLVVDGDGDRIYLVDETGRVHDGDAILGFLGRTLAQEGTLRGGAVVGTVTTNGGLERFLQGQGLELVRTPVGDRHVAAAMRERACNLGGESSGHVLTPDWCPTGDGSRVGLQVLVRAARGARPLSDLLGAIPRFPRASAKVPDGGSRPPIEAVLGDPELVAMLAEVEGAGCRPLLRYSGTEPCLRIQVEGPAANLVEAWVQSLAEATARILARA